MAYINNEDENNSNTQGMNNSQKQQEEQNGSNPPQLSGAVSGTSSGPSASPTATAKPTSSGMTGFQNYQKANQGAATNNLANATTTNVNNQAQSAKTGISQASQSFGSKVDAGSLADRDNAVNDVKNIVQQARNISAPAAPAPTTTPAAAPTAQAQSAKPVSTSATAPTTANSPASNAASPDYLNGLNSSRFQDVINAKYQGPESMRQSGDYNKVSDKVNQAQTSLNQAQTAQGREELLRNMFSQNGNDYTQGQNKLDSGLLNASQSGVQQLQNVANSHGNLNNQLDQAQLASANLAQNRTQQINDIQNQARDVFGTGLNDERNATENRLSNVIQNWDKLPEYFKNIIRNKANDNKSVLDTQLGQVKADGNYDSVTSQYNKLAAQKAAELSALQNFNTNYEKAHPGTIDYADRARHYNDEEAKWKAINAQFDPIAAQKTALDNKINALQNNTNLKAANLSPEEAAILGVKSGEGFYNLGTDAIKTAAYDKDKLISRDEQARQAALSQLAKLDQSQQLDSNLKYADASKAGTQSALDALDTKGIRQGLNSSEQNFQDYAKNANITGYGSKKNKTSGKRYNAQESANLGDLLKKSGYDFGHVGQNDAVANNDVLKNMVNGSSSMIGGQDPTGAAGAMDATASPWSSLGSSSTGAAQTVGNLFGTVGLNQIGGALGLGSFGNAVGGLFGSGASAQSSRDDASQFAHEDLQRKVKSGLDSQGFQNRFGVADNTKPIEDRKTALQALLNSLDKTNT